MTSIQEVMFKEAYIIIQNAKKITNELDPVVDLIVNSVKQDHHIILTGIGKNSDICKKMAATYCSIGIPAFYLDSYHALHGDLGVILPNRVVISFSKSGNTPELVHTFEAAGKIGAKLVSITCNPNSEVGKTTKKYNGTDIVLDCEFEVDALNTAPTASSTLFLTIGDAIGCVASEKLGFTKEDFLLRHPAGSLGSSLKKELHQE